MAVWNWSGARWWKFDLHTHTPASLDYGKGPRQAELRQRTPSEWLLDYMRAGVDCLAVTDQNTGAWIDPLKTALAELETGQPDGFRQIYLFPGVEISVHGGIHVLAIFDPSKTTSDIDTLLGSTGFQGSKGSSDSVTTKSFPDVVAEIHRAGGIAIPAHVDNQGGLFTLHGTTLEQALDCREIIAMEVRDRSSAKPAQYHEKHLSWTEVIGSDSHHPSGTVGQRYPGSHFTWVKMAQPNLEGLQLALFDGRLSVQRSDEQVGDPNAHAPSLMESIEVSDARYMGRSQPFQINFNPWLNAVIGGRGTGKSTLLEFLRIALRREEEIRDSPLASDLGKYRRVYNKRDDDGLLTPESHFVVTYRKNGTRYRVQWSVLGSLNPIEVEDDTGNWRAEQGEVALRFPARIYSQKQVFELAKAPLALLRIVDEAPGVGRRSWEERWREAETRFLSLRAQAREIEAGLAEEPRLLGELEDTKRKLAVFEGAGHAAVLKEYQRRMRQRRAVETWQEGWASTGDRLRGLAEELVPDPLDAAVFEDGDDPGASLIEKSGAPLSVLRRVRDRLEELAREADDVVAQWNKSREESDWKRALDAAISGYEELRRRLADEGAGDPSTYGELVQRRHIIEAHLQDFESRRKQVESVRRESDSCLESLLALRRELTDRRTTFVGEVLANNKYVRIQVTPYGACETVEGEIRTLIQREGGGFEKDIEGLISILPVGSPDATVFEQRLGALKTRLREIAKGSYSSGDLRDQRFANHLAKLSPEAFDRLDAWFPEDTLEVEYSTGADDASFRPIQEGSPGQKTAALLAFLLSYGDEPIVLDQPEDDLDNHLIYDLIVGQLRNIKRRRQVIVVTHNANIVVNGDAELVVALAARNGETQKECVGSLQERAVRETICAVMEGGREAFERRYRRISLEGRYV
jgi:energy-coupling factor transporter ATP-binding protein EcfA2